MTLPLEKAPGLNAIALGLATGTPDVSAFLPRTPGLAAVAARAGAVVRAYRPRALPAGADPRLAAAARGESALVLTGQQVGLFGGPLLTLAKALAAESLAADLASAGTRATFGFWCASEDHDLVEVTRAVLPTREGPKDFGPDAAPLAANRAPVGAIRIADVADPGRILAEAAAGLGAPADDEAVAALSAAHAGATFKDAFVATLVWLLGGPVPSVDAADAADKPALVPLAVRLVKERADVRATLAARARALAEAGYPLQVTTDPASLPLFVREAGERLLLVESGAGLALKGRDGRYTADEVIARLESGAWLPSFSALTRPLAASVLYPVGAAVLGPAEVAYWAQSFPLFAWAGIEPPAVLLRPLVAVETAAARRLLGKLGLTLADVLDGEEALLRKRGAGEARDALARVAAARDRALADLDAARDDLLAVDPGLARAVAATKGNVAYAFGKLVAKTEAAAGRRDGHARDRVSRLVNELVPGGALAERVYSVLPYVLRSGREAVVSALRKEARWDRAGVVEVPL